MRKLSLVLGLFLVLSLVLAACAAPEPETVEVIVTEVVEVPVEVEVEVEKLVEVVGAIPYPDGVPMAGAAGEATRFPLDEVFVYEALDEDKRVTETFAVVASEIVEVPAGRFPALKVVREASSRDSDQYWFAPEVRWYVRWIGRRGEDQFEERLREYHMAPRLIPEPAPVETPSKTR